MNAFRICAKRTTSKSIIQITKWYRYTHSMKFIKRPSSPLFLFLVLVIHDAIMKLCTRCANLIGWSLHCGVTRRVLVADWLKVCTVTSPAERLLLIGSKFVLCRPRWKNVADWLQVRIVTSPTWRQPWAFSNTNLLIILSLALRARPIFATREFSKFEFSHRFPESSVLYKGFFSEYLKSVCYSLVSVLLVELYSL